MLLLVMGSPCVPAQRKGSPLRQGAGTESASAATLVRDYGKAEARSSRSSTRRPTGRHGAAPIRGSASRAISRAGSGFIRGRAPAPFAERYYGTWGSGAAWYSAWHSCPHNSRATDSPVEAFRGAIFVRAAGNAG